MKEEAPLVYIVDDDIDFRDAMHSWLRSIGCQAIGFGSVDEFVKHSRAPTPSCLPLDVRMPGRDPFEFQEQLHRSKDDIPIIFITGHGNVPMSVRAMRNGAITFLLKPFPAKDLFDAIRDGINRDRSRRRAEQSTADVHACVSSLSPRERQILSYVCRGRTNREIAQTLGLQEITIKVHRASAMRKMKTRSVAELMRKIQDADL
jgi:RNA polymerase sigma factor (sigma-70 family)